MVAWVKALLDPSPVHSEETKKPIASPPPFIFAAGDKPNLGPPSTPANAGRGRGRPRASSPVKGTPAAAGKASSPRKRATKAMKEAKEAAKEVNAAAARQASESLHAAVDGVSEAAGALAKKGEKALQGSPMVNGEKTPAKKSKKKEKDEGSSSAAKKKAAAEPVKKEEGKVTVEVTTGAQVNGDVDGEQTSVKVSMPSGSPELPLPQSTEQVIATAKEMVAEARKLEAESASPKGGSAKEGGAKGRGKGKRKLEEVKDSEDDEAEEKVKEGPSAKRAKVAEQEVRRQKVRNRALLGAGLTLAIGYVGDASTARDLLLLTTWQCRHPIRAWRLMVWLGISSAQFSVAGRGPTLIEEPTRGPGFFDYRYDFASSFLIPFSRFLSLAAGRSLSDVW